MPLNRASPTVPKPSARQRDRIRMRRDSSGLGSWFGPDRERPQPIGGPSPRKWCPRGRWSAAPIEAPADLLDEGCEAGLRLGRTADPLRPLDELDDGPNGRLRERPRRGGSQTEEANSPGGERDVRSEIGVVAV